MSNSVKQYISDWEGPYPVEQTLLRVEAELNKPFFDHGATGTSALRAVRRCWVDIQLLPYFGPAGKTFFYALLEVADKWKTIADSAVVDDAERALFRYNRALIDSVVLEAVTQSKRT